MKFKNYIINILQERKSDVDFYNFANKIYIDFINDRPNQSDIKIIQDETMKEPAKSFPKDKIMYINTNLKDLKVAFFHELRHIWDYEHIGRVAFKQERLKQSTIDKLNNKEITTNDLTPDDVEYNISKKIERKVRPMYKQLTGKDLSDSQLNFLTYFSTNHEQNAFFINLVVELLEFIKGKPSMFPHKLVDQFLNYERDINSELYKTILDLKINDKYEKFRRRLISFLVDLYK